MTNTELLAKLGALVREERKITEDILALIREAESRRLYLELGYASAYEWLVKAYGYSRAAAHRRIQAARLVAAVPEAREKLAEGSLNLSTLAQVQSAVQRAERDCGKSLAVRAALVRRVEGKSAEETQRILLAEFPGVKPKESLRIVSAEEAKLSVTLDEETLANLRRVKELLSHAKPNATFAELIAHLARDYVERKAPEKKPASGSRRVTSPQKLALQKARGQCEFRDEKTGKVCGSRHQVEVDHILPQALGGTDAPENLRCLCKQHNLYEAERKLGKEFMNRFRLRL